MIRKDKLEVAQLWATDGTSEGSYMSSRTKNDHEVNKLWQRRHGSRSTLYDEFTQPIVGGKALHRFFSESSPRVSFNTSPIALYAIGE